MSEVFGSPSYKYSEAEIAAACKAIKAFETYLSDGGSGSVSSSQIADLLILIGKEHRPDQCAVYKAYWDGHYDGRIPVEAWADRMRTCHRIELFAQVLAKGADKNGDGFIDRNEFEGILKMVTIHDPDMAALDTTFENFVAEADTNKDGKVSVEECSQWIINKQTATKK